VRQAGRRANVFTLTPISPISADSGKSTFEMRRDALAKLKYPKAS
jgi:hypothetical protein